jgi:hypothetical protein
MDTITGTRGRPIQAMGIVLFLAGVLSSCAHWASLCPVNLLQHAWYGGPPHEGIPPLICHTPADTVPGVLLPAPTTITPTSHRAFLPLPDTRLLTSCLVCCSPSPPRPTGHHP